MSLFPLMRVSFAHALLTGTCMYHICDGEKNGNKIIGNTIPHGNCSCGKWGELEAWDRLTSKSLTKHVDKGPLTITLHTVMTKTSKMHDHDTQRNLQLQVRADRLSP